MDSQERLQARLDNVTAVEPMLSALRTISLSSGLLALNRVQITDRYAVDLIRILAQVVASLPAGDRVGAPAVAGRSTSRHPVERLMILALGTERGLCGSFNETLAAHADFVVREHTNQGREVRLAALGKSAEKALRRRGQPPMWSLRLPARGLPPYGVAVRLTQEWLADYLAEDMGVQVIYNARRGLSGYAPTSLQLLPPDVPTTSAPTEWPPIIETDPASLYHRALALWLSGTFYGIMLRSAAAEHSARYQLMEGAAQNAQRLTEELKLLLQVARQEAITSEIQDLMSGAGLVGAATS